MKRCFSALMLLLFLLLGPQCKPWKKWDIHSDSTWYQIRFDANTKKWILLIRKENQEIPDDFQKEVGPFDGDPPRDIENFPWFDDQIEAVFGSRDSVQYKWTLVTWNQRTENEVKKCDIKIFNHSGAVTGSYTVNGVCESHLLNERDYTKLIFTDRMPGKGWILIDYLTGKKLGESPGSLPPDINNQEIRDLEVIGDKYLIVEQRINMIRISIYTLAGVFLVEFVIPGQFKAAIQNGINKKLFVTESNNGTYGDIIQLTNQTIMNVGGSMNARSALPGVSADLQYHKIDNKDRWVHAAYNSGNNSTTIRIIDDNGIVLRVHAYTGRIINKKVMGLQKDRKVWALERANDTDVAVVNLLTGDLIRYQTVSGAFRTLEETMDNTKARVSTDLSGTPNSQEVALY